MTWDISPGTTLETLTAEWLSDISGQGDPGTHGMYRLHMLTHLVPHFGEARSITVGTIAGYCRNRLKRVMRTTLKKERSTLRSFLSWCVERGYLTEAPELPALPKRATGTRYAVRRRGKATFLHPEECRAIIAALPRWSSPRKGQTPFAVRARFAVMYETALRPGTLDKLSMPEHYTRGASMLRIEDAIDKARFGRDLPLNQAARDALESAAIVSGIIFGKHDYRVYLERAAKKAIPTKSDTFTAYDLRHARLTELAGKGDLPGVQYLAGHRRAETTAIYVHPNLRAAMRVLDAASGMPTRDERGLVGIANAFDIVPVRAKKRGRTSTSFRTLEPESSVSESNTALGKVRAAAVALRRAALEGQSVDREVLVDFALAVLGLTDEGRLALAVLEGDEFAPRRALELAHIILGQAEASGERGVL